MNDNIALGRKNCAKLRINSLTAKCFYSFFIGDPYFFPAATAKGVAVAIAGGIWGAEE